MPRTDRHQVFTNGVLVSDTPVIISDEQIFREEVPTRLTASYTTLRSWAADAEATYTDWPTLSNAQKDARQREIVRRLGKLCDGLADFIMRDSLDGS